MNDIVTFTGWTPERIDELKAYAAEGLKATLEAQNAVAA